MPTSTAKGQAKPRRRNTSRAGTRPRIPSATGNKAKGIGDSIGDWCACLDCARLIDAQDAEGLAKRSAATFPEICGAAGISKDETFLIISMIQTEMFWAYLKGPGVRVGLN